MSNFTLYGFCLVVSASLVALLSMSTDFFVHWVNDIVIPCQHDSVWTGVSCNCDNTRGVYAGDYCDECQCEHQGICAISNKGSDSRWGCLCPSHKKWTGLLCDKCYTERQNVSKAECSGPCLNTSTHQHFGIKCDTVCVPGGSSLDPICREIASGGGVCNACNGHGTCGETGTCECDDGWFTTLGGEQCALSCETAGIACPEDRGICSSIGGELQCVCAPGYYGRNCELSCGPANGTTCSGHGTCGLSALGVPACTCELHYVGDSCEYACPGDPTYPSTCSGHGRCSVEMNEVSGEDEAMCACNKNTQWSGRDCSCNARFSCSGHGTCQDDGSCLCNDWTYPSPQHWDGIACQKCQPNWYGRECHLMCDADAEYVPDAFAQRAEPTDGVHIGCNGFGQCEVISTTLGDRVQCACRGTDATWFCSKCEESYYPLTSVKTAAAYCTDECNEGTCSYHGVCNEAYDGTNNLCICDTITVGTVDFDTIDPVEYCSTCKVNWFPDLQASDAPCTHYCAAEGEIEGRIIVFDQDRTLQGDVNAQKVCARNGQGFDVTYSPDPDCRVCSGGGTCDAAGQCICNDARTGVYCEIDCGMTANGQVCNGHGRCIRNDLDMWFDPYTTEYRCECQPYDTYTSETRQRLLKRGVRVTPPPTPDFYGKYCEFHCPRYNEEICAGRGECKTGIAVSDTTGVAENCSSDDDCASISGAFCAQLTSPWDSLMPGEKSFFSSGPESPGYFACASSQNCVDAIYSIEWDSYCVNMLNGWYPSVLNTATCTYHIDDTLNCREKVEDFFVSNYENNLTWCQSALRTMTPIVFEEDDDNSAACNKMSHASETVFNINRELCFTWSLKTTCANNPECIYDQTIDYIDTIDQKCTQREVDGGQCCPPGVVCECELNAAGDGCQTKTYCRARNCQDAILDNNVEALCVSVEPACENYGPEYWSTFCTNATGRLRNISDMSVQDTFYTCIMYENSVNPYQVRHSVPGSIDIYGEVKIHNIDTENIPIQDFRRLFLASRAPMDTTSPCGGNLTALDLSGSDFCTQHLDYVLPAWYVHHTEAPNWFREYMVVCSGGIEGLYMNSATAVDRAALLRKNCDVEYNCGQRLNPTWDETCDGVDSVYSPSAWTLQCLTSGETMFDGVTWSDFPPEVSDCTLRENTMVTRWGGTQWDVNDVISTFKDNCERGLEAPWIPSEEPIPGVCDMGACADGHTCTLCSETSLDCHQGVLCVAPNNIDCLEDTPCRNGGECHQPVFFLASNKYLCEWNHSTPVLAYIAGNEYAAEITSRDVLVVPGVTTDTDGVIVVVKDNHTVETMTDPDVFEGADVRIRWRGLPLECTVGDLFCPRTNTCVSDCGDCGAAHGTVCLGQPVADANTGPVLPPPLSPCTSGDTYNWYEYCSTQTMGQSLSTSAGNGLKNGWSGYNALLGPQQLLLTDTAATADGQLEIVIDAAASDSEASLSLTINGEESVWHVSGEVLAYTNFSRSRYTNNTIYITYFGAMSGTVAMRAVFNKRLVLQSLKLNRVEQILPFGNSLNRQRFYMGEEADVTNYAAWTFEADGTTSIYREQQESQPSVNTMKCCTVRSLYWNQCELVTTNMTVAQALVYACQNGTSSIIVETCREMSNGTVRCAAKAIPPNGQRWALETSYQKRIHGWAKVQSSNNIEQEANMDVYNADASPIVRVHVFENIVYVNNVKTPCRIQPFQWWHWTIDLRAMAERRFRSNAEIRIHTDLSERENRTMFEQTWDIVVRVDECTFQDTYVMNTTARERKTPGLLGSHFHHVTDTPEHACASHCHSHEQCRQWSWTPAGQDCFLHAAPCHEGGCTLGSHVMNTFHPRGVSYFDIWSAAKNTRVWWNHIRAEDIIPTPTQFVCTPIDIQAKLPELWRAPFEALYTPLVVDATRVCNAMHTMWQPIPGYATHHCSTDGDCEYQRNDLASCADYMQHAKPNVSSVDACEDEKDVFLDLDWTSYCRYERSFYAETTNGPIAFLGGRVIRGAEQTLENMCQTVGTVREDANSECPDAVDSEWFQNCFARTSAYERFCSAGCIQEIERMLDDTDDDPSICKIRKQYLNLTAAELDDDCECSLNDLIVTDFCLVQNAYHVGDSVRIPELYNSDCSSECTRTLQDAMNRTQWRTWCKDLSEGVIPGVCSKTVCECDTDNLGVAGTRCELNCPTGVVNGEEIACSGRNGRCFAVDNPEIVDDLETQKLNDEYRNASLVGPNVPVWKRGPSPTAEGRCQCALGSGSSCSIPCDKCNNGTYGHDAASQYGICDSFSGVCRGLAPWMRYNFVKASRDDLSMNTTSFETSLGLAKWVYADRFLFEKDTTLIRRALEYVNDRNGLQTPTLAPPTMQEQDAILITLEVFEHLCWDSIHQGGEYFEYLDNDASVTRQGLVLGLGVTDLKTVNLPPPKQGCRPIEFSVNLTLCYDLGNIYAKDASTGQSLIVLQRNNNGITKASDTVYLEGMTFTTHDNGVLYAFGGEIEYGTSTQKMNELYSIQVERKPWSPVDIVVLDWKNVPMSGELPPGQQLAPIAVSDFVLYLLSRNADTDDEYTMYEITLPTPVESSAISKVYSVDVPTPENRVVQNMKNNGMGQFVLYFTDETLLFTPEAAIPFTQLPYDNTSIAVFDRQGGYQDTDVTCSLEMTRDGENNTLLKVANQTVATVPTSLDAVRIYIEEWTVIDVTTQASLVQRFRDTLDIGHDEPVINTDALSASDKMEALALVERIYMHQGRWLAADMFHVNTMLSPGIWPGEHMFQHVSPSNIFFTQAFQNVFDSLDFGFFESDMRTSPTELSISIEGRARRRRLLIQGNYVNERTAYTQTFYIGMHKMELSLSWFDSSLRLVLSRAGGTGYVGWYYPDAPCRTFVLSIEVEDWLVNTEGGQFTDQYTHRFTDNQVNGRPAMFNLFVTRTASHTHSMKRQTSLFLSYSPSHCLTTASDRCPGLLPYVQVPCSGHGRCNTACQCVCEVAPSVLQATDTALQNVLSSQSPYRGSGCEITCPGFDGYDLTSICSGRGTCQYDGSCACKQGFIGDACQFTCPLDEDGNPCSTHGGCGTRATESTSFQFTGDNYLDTVTSMNKKNYIMALTNFYGPCYANNYLFQQAEFRADYFTNGGSFASKEGAFSKCETLNLQVRQNATVNRDEEFRDYPYGMCIGVIKDDISNRYLVAYLRKPSDNPKRRALAGIDIFDCAAAECTFEPDETNDNAIRGFETKLLSPSFEITMKYVHGASSGTEHYRVNGHDFYITTQWTPYAFSVHFRTQDKITEFRHDESVMMFKMVVEDQTMHYTLYKDYSPIAHDAKQLWMAPLFEKKYVRLVTMLDAYVLTKDTPYLQRELAEYDCDLELLCEGIVQWDERFRENLFSLYSSANAVDGFETHPMPTNSHLYYGKMSRIYQGRENDAMPCDTIFDKRSKYPSVEYAEAYDIPIQNIDLTLATDADTNSIVIGRGLWTHCWTRDTTATTKLQCYKNAKNSLSGALGFAFSDDEGVCLIYHKLTEPTRIKLGRYNSESRLTLFHPCSTENITKWKTVT